MSIVSIFPCQVNEHIFQACLSNLDCLHLHTAAFQDLLQPSLIDAIVHNHTQVVASQPGALHQGAGFKDGKAGQQRGNVNFINSPGTNCLLSASGVSIASSLPARIMPTRLQYSASSM